jgi:hypothetical protein
MSVQGNQVECPGGRFVLEKESEGGEPGTGVLQTAIWDATSGRQHLVFPAGDRLIAFDPTANHAGTLNSAAGQITIWDVPQKTWRHRLTARYLRNLPATPRLTTRHHTSDGRLHQTRQDPVEMRIHPSGKYVAYQYRGVLTF